ncbi:ORF6N domain-containing protein [Algoriphagus hitonicola]|uniref:ORF6N domain-containing protein n=1 Tax=Algoriphagus hitonicola TaxID=435880 RepID=A0A1I2VCX2_9BACT|nr:ORF6N domain-containing protein [Algoriphagus hitonicola]SFG86299.1 ORF6N domain-containing protein [Algoriphagus hitonicola]
MTSLERKEIENRIHTVRGLQVMLDSDLAELYGTETKFINRAVKRNQQRFPPAFTFQLSIKEWENLRFQIGTSNSHGGRRTVPFVFTEQGIAMLSAVLQTETAIQVSIKIIQAFVEMRKFLVQNASLFQRLDQLEIRQLENDKKFDRLFKALEKGQLKAEKGIFFEGQVFDAYVFVSELIKKAKREIILIDNYVNESVLTLFSKRNHNVKATIFTKNSTQGFLLDLEKYNSQYPKIEVSNFSKSHDRFLILDKSELYHFGASLKDLGKKWFAFSRMDDFVEVLLNEVNSNL